MKLDAKLARDSSGAGLGEVGGPKLARICTCPHTRTHAGMPMRNEQTHSSNTNTPMHSYAPTHSYTLMHRGPNQQYK